MSTKKATKRALLTSILAICLCLVMLVGSTFAWFTDTASTGVNKITSGNLHVQIQDASNEPIDTLKWVKENGTAIEKQEDILWEPGCTYLLTPFKIVNTGNLALKYKIIISGLDGNSELLDVIKFTYKVGGVESKLDEEGYLKVGEDTGMITVSAHMDEAAGNDYQDKTLTGVKFTVYATQDTVENDSFNNMYDKDAEYPVVLAADKDAFKDGKIFINNWLQTDARVVLTDDVDLNGSITLGMADTTLLLDLNGHKLTMGQFVVSNAATVEISDSVGTGKIDFTSRNGIDIRCSGASVVMNGGTLTASSSYTTGSTFSGAAVAFNAANTSFVMNGGKLVVDNNQVPEGSAAILMTYSNSTFIMNGGEIEKNVGTLAAIQASGDGNTKGTTIEINGGSIKSNTVAIYHPQSGSLTVNNGYIAGETAIYAKSGTLAFNGGTMHAMANTASGYQYNGSGCVATGDAVVIDACGYPGGNPVVTVTGGTYTVTADGAHGFAYYKYNGNTATITNTSGIEIFE